MSKNGIFPIFWPPVKSEGGPLRQKYLTTNVRPRMVYKRAKFEGSTQTCLANQVIWDVFTLRIFERFLAGNAKEE